MKFTKKIFMTACMIMLGISTVVTNARDKNISRSCGCDCVETENEQATFQKLTVQVGTDNQGNPIIISYVIKGSPAEGKPTLVLSDPYLGKAGWKCQIDELSKCFVVIAIDPVGTGESSKNAPTNLDGVYGVAGYSFDQYAIFLHEFLAALNIQQPIVYVGVDPQGQVGIKYSVRYANDSLALSKLVLVNSSPSSIVSDNPCKLSFLTNEEAAGLAAVFAGEFPDTGPCVAMCDLLASSLNEPACPQAAKDILNAAVNFGAAMSPAIFTRLLTQTYAEDVSSLLVQIPIPVLYLYSVTDNTNLLSRKALGIVFTGYCPCCVAGCTNNTAILPITDCQFHTLKGKGTLSYRTDYKRVNRYIKEFVLGCDLDCCVCPFDINIPVICPVCS